jgi:uncharacterized protein (DUF1499 family)
MSEAHRLAPCPSRPNCVSTEAEDDAKRMEPIPFSGSGEFAVKRLVEVIEGMAGAKVKKREALYVHAEFTSRVFRFVDDVDLVIDDEARLIRFRSASRQGRWDLGANRRRMNELRRRFAGG